MQITKDRLKGYLSTHHDVTLKEIIEHFNITKKELVKLNEILKELIKVRFIEKIWCLQHKQYEFEKIR